MSFKGKILKGRILGKLGRFLTQYGIREIELDVGTWLKNIWKKASGIISLIDTLGVTEKIYIDATTSVTGISGHTDTDGVIDMNTLVGADSVTSLNIFTKLGDDFDGVIGIISQIAGATAGGTSGNEMFAFQALMAGDDDDTDMTYIAFHAPDFIANGGAGEACGVCLGTGYEDGWFSESGNFTFAMYSPVFTPVSMNDNGYNLVLKGGDGQGTNKNAGILYIHGGLPTGTGNNGYVAIDGTQAIVPDHIGGRNDLLIGGRLEVNSVAWFDGGIYLPTAKFVVFDKASGNGIKVDTATPTFGWRDLLGQIRTRGVGATDPGDATYIGNIKAYQFAVNDECWVDYHIPHDYVKGTDIFLHFHWSHISAIVTGGAVTWGADITYAKGHNQAAFPATVNTTVVGNASTTQYQHIITEVQVSASTPGAGQIDTDDLEPDGVIMIRGYLSANNITSSGAVPDPFLHFKDIHYQSTNIATKGKVPDFYA